jgi:hypothetical protein
MERTDSVCERQNGLFYRFGVGIGQAFLLNQGTDGLF